MTTDVEICNSAFGKFTGTRIQSLTENTKAARLCGDAYPRLRDKLLRGHTWNFNTRRAKLAQSSTVPAFGWDHQYQLPTDWARTVAVFDSDRRDNPIFDYVTEGKFILADASEIYLIYSALIIDPNEFDTMFREVLAYEVAVELAGSFAKSSATAERLRGELRDLYADARSTDDQDDPPEQFRATTWDSVRG